MTSESTPSPQSSSKSKANIGAIFLIGIGVIFLLQNYNLLPQSIWGTIWKFWPLFLILFGISQISKGKKNSALFLNSFALLLFLSIIGYSYISHNQAYTLPNFRLFSNSNPSSSKSVSTQYQNVTQGQYPLRTLDSKNLRLDIGFGQLHLSDSPTADHFKLKSQLKNVGTPQLQVEQEEMGLNINLKTQTSFNIFGGFDKKASYEVTLGTQELPTKIDLDIGAGQAQIDLDQTKIESLDIHTGAGSAIISLSQQSLPQQPLDIDIGVGSANFTLPSEVGYKINHDIGIGSLQIDQQVLNGKGTYTSNNYDQAAQKITLNAKVGTGSLTITTN